MQYLYHKILSIMILVSILKCINKILFKGLLIHYFYIKVI